MDANQIVAADHHVGRVTADSRASLNAYSRSDIDRARIIADSIARSAATLSDTLAIADQSLIVGLGSIARGDATSGCHHLARSLIASSLAAWQLDQLAIEAIGRRDPETANERRAAAELQIVSLPGRVRLAANALHASSAGAPCLAELRGALFAFVSGSRFWQGCLVESAQGPWLRSLVAAFERESYAIRRSDVSGFGVPAINPQPRAGEVKSNRRRDGRPTLSGREREVLMLIVTGLTTAEIAYRLGVKATTVSTLVGRIFNKLGVNNRPAAVAIALRSGLCGGFDDLAA
jgi:DNA-binding CsgD family transcriptional regulator